MTAFRAHKIFNVPRTTIIDKVSGRSPIPRQIGITTILSRQEDNLLVKWILYLADSGFPVCKEQLLDSVEMLIKQLKRPNTFKEGRPWRHWYEGFMKRHPEISARMAQNLTNARASVTETKIKRWFSEISQYLTNENIKDILDDPSRVYNCDETAMYLNPKGEKVIVRKGEKAVYTFINNDEKECLTTLITCNANGQLAPPMIMYSYKRVPRAIIEKVNSTWGIGRSESGWMTGESFYEYITNVFYPWLVKNNAVFPIILFLDGHKSHLIMDLSNFCSNHQITLISLYPNSTHILQPLDVAVFKPLKTEYKKVIRQWRLKNNGEKVARENFAPILEQTLNSLTSLNEIIRNGFRTCGLFPFNPNAINYKEFFKDTGPPNIPNDDNVSEVKEFLRFIEAELPDKINSFKSSGDIWMGPLEDKSFYFLAFNTKSMSHYCRNC